MFNLRQVAAVVLTTALSASAFAAGYEKNILWSGRHAGVAGTGAAWASGPEALYFNPAGLVTKQGDRSIVVDISPTMSQFKAPVVQDNVQQSGSTDYYAPFALFYQSTPSDKFGYGAGIYVGGGSKATYGELDLSSQGTYTMKPTLYSNLAEIEASLGAAYNVSSALKVGAAYRFAMINAAFSSAQSLVLPGPTNAVAVVDLQDLKGTAHSFRVGAQFHPEQAPYGVGVSVRAGMNVAVAGTSAPQLEASGGGMQSITGGGVTVHTTLPAQVSAGGYYDIKPDEWRAHLEYVWTQYSKVKTVGIDGTTTTAFGTADIADLTQNWKDQHSVRVAGEYMKTKYPVRFGYAYTTNVENPDYPKAIFFAPSPTHTITIGTGRGTDDGKWMYDLAADYNWASKSTNQAASDIGSRRGSYETMTAAIHAGVSYKF